MPIDEMKQTIVDNHYTHSVPSGKSWYFHFDGAIIVFSIPANKNISNWLLGESNAVIELSRLWAPDGHRSSLLTEVISRSISAMRPAWGRGVKALISYADPNVGHEGFVYKAASWTCLGVSEESRYYRQGEQVVSRRKFHSGSNGKTKSEISELGYTQIKLPGKIRYAKGLTKSSRRKIISKSRIIGFVPKHDNDNTKVEAI